MSRRALDPEDVAAKILAVECAIDAQCPAQQSGPPGLVDNSADRLQRANQYGMRCACLSCDRVQAIPEAVDEVDVRMPWRAEHDLGARCASSGGVGREVGRSLISLGLDDAADTFHAAIIVNQVFSDELARDCQGAARGK